MYCMVRLTSAVSPWTQQHFKWQNFQAKSIKYDKITSIKQFVCEGRVNLQQKHVDTFCCATLKKKNTNVDVWNMYTCTENVQKDNSESTLWDPVPLFKQTSVEPNVCFHFNILFKQNSPKQSCYISSIWVILNFFTSTSNLTCLHLLFGSSVSPQSVWRFPEKRVDIFFGLQWGVYIQRPALFFLAQVARVWWLSLTFIFVCVL